MFLYQMLYDRHWYLKNVHYLDLRSRHIKPILIISKILNLIKIMYEN